MNLFVHRNTYRENNQFPIIKPFFKVNISMFLLTNFLILAGCFSSHNIPCSELNCIALKLNDEGSVFSEETSFEAEIFADAELTTVDRIYSYAHPNEIYIWSYIDESEAEEAYLLFLDRIQAKDLQSYNLKTGGMVPDGEIQRIPVNNIGDEAMLFKVDNYSSGQSLHPFTPEVSSVLITRKSNIVFVIFRRFDYKDEILDSGKLIEGTLIDLYTPLFTK